VTAVSTSTGRSALRVGSGIFLSRITGFVRDLTIAFFFGTGLAVDAYTAALRIPNILRNLLGEGTLSASFVPVYSDMLETQGTSASGPTRLARGVLGLVVALAALLAGLGVLLAPILARMVAPGFDAEQTALTTELVRILFPMSGVMIVAAWCLGVLNSHRRFFLPYVAPVLWNGAQIAGLLLGARLGWGPLVHVLAWSTLAGSVLQLGIQLPTARRLAGSLRPAFDRTWEPVRRVARNAGPVAAGQGIFQVSSFLDVVLASTLTAAGATGAVSGLYFAQRIAYLPLGLFGVSVATASLPEMSREEGAAALRPHLVDGFFKILFFVLPSAVVFLLFGDLFVAIIYQRGAFGPDSALIVRWILGGYALGIVASSLVKLFASGFHALQNTVTPMRIAAVSVVTGVSIGAGLMFWLGSAGFGARAAAGLAVGGAAGAWLNLALLWHHLQRMTGPLLGPDERRGLFRLCVATAAAVLVSVPARWWLGSWIAGPGLLVHAATLLGTLVAGGIPFLLIARRPPTHAPGPESG
jgi:putative peptidoglycan lipid II flippase